MLFNSYIFIFLFLPIALNGYFALNKMNKYILAKYFLVGMSLWFYAYFNIKYLWIILASILVNYICHRLLLSPISINKKYAPKIIFPMGLVFNLGLLFYYKYCNFFVDNINAIFKTSIYVENILLPLGISFFTFQQIAFLTDSRRGEVSRQSVDDYMLFVTFFPQLIAGPIVSHNDMIPQFQNPELKKVDLRNMYTGVRIFIIGLSKKILLADVLGQPVQWGYEHLSLMRGSGAVLLMLLYTFQLYFDFSGYCDMARGIGYMFNIHIPINFSSPYKARNIIDFWNRWHVTLTRFFTKYVYIPLGGNRGGVWRTYINVLIVFCISGVWHGAGYTFIVWGILHGVMNVLTRIAQVYKERLLRCKKSNYLLEKANTVFSVVFTFVCVNVLWVFFRAESLEQATTLVMQLFDVNNSSGVGELATLMIPKVVEYIFKVLKVTSIPYIYYMPLIVYLIIMAIIIWGCRNVSELEDKWKPTYFNSIMLAVLLFACIMSLSGVSTFLYFNF